jgi:hypothetical protein
MRYVRSLSFFLFLGGALLLAGCSPDRQIGRAAALEKKGKTYKAWEKYQEFAAKNPQHARAPEAIFRAGWIAQQHFNDCFMATTFYDEVLTRYPNSDPWARASLLQKNNCPDYFPLVTGSKWTEVDSDTKGQNARIEIACEAVSGEGRTLPSQAGVMVRQFYAGEKKSLTTRAIYRKDQMELREFRGENTTTPTVLLHWPVEAGFKWSTQIDGRLARFEIASMSAQASVMAGDFDDCLVVRSNFPGESSMKNEYYAPGVGRVLTTIMTDKGEKRITELAKYQVEEISDILAGGK